MISVHAPPEVKRNKSKIVNLKSPSPAGHVGIESACADGLPGIGETQSRQVSKPRKGKTKKSKK
ncbi:hypothetical protein [uncultured Nostoc sp.]|uniref:hypothetical protein n=1 Tax=uncultured Nostoc sp. TaxID=340711 RepID=UPI0035C9FD06